MGALEARRTVRPEDVGFSSRLDRIDETIARLIAKEKISGAVTLVSRRGHVAHFSAQGLMDREANRPMRRDAIFRIYSMTKPITCTAVMMLFEEGHFLLDDPVADFLPEFAKTRVFVGESGGEVELTDLERPISIRHLLMHTSGISYDWSAHPVIGAMYQEEKVGRYDEPLSEKVPRLAAIPLNHQPGERWTYGFSHDVLGRLVEVISGQAFDEFLRRRIFEPLEMPDTGFEYPTAEIDRVAAPYAAQGGGLDRIDRDEIDMSRPRRFLSGGGGLVSTATDYARFCQTLLSGGAAGDVRLLGRKTVELMTANHTGDSSPLPPDWPQDWSLAAYGFGLGMRVLVRPAMSNAGGAAGEYGWSGALSTYFWIDPAEELYGIFMTQLEPANFRYGRQVAALTYQALLD